MIKYLQPKRKGVKIKVNSKRTIHIPMYCIVEVESLTTGGFVSVKALTGSVMNYGEDKMFVKKIYVESMLKDKRNFKILDHFHFFDIKT